jgi:hypothetical protein
MTLNTRNRHLTTGLLLLLPLVWAGNVATQQSSGKPIRVEAPKPKKEKFKGEVLVATRQSLVVRGRENKNLVRTFTYSEKVAAKINKWFDENKIFKHGDRVEIVYLAGTDQAVKIKGKPGQKR